MGIGIKTPTINHKQRRFIDEYLIDLNATRAAIKAGYSAKTARQIGARLLSNVNIKNEINYALSIICKKQKHSVLLAVDIAIHALIDVAKNGNGTARVNAANSILDRAGHKFCNIETVINSTEISAEESKVKHDEAIEEFIEEIKKFDSSRIAYSS